MSLGVVAAYTADVDDLGKKLKALREARGLRPKAIARQALGDGTHATKLRDFANYLSRMERGRETNPSLSMLEQLANGFGYADVVRFLTDLHNPPLRTVEVQADNRPPATDASGQPLRAEHEHHPVSPPPAPIIFTLADDVYERIGYTIAAALASSATRPPTRKRVPSGHAARPAARAAHRRHD